MRDNTILYFLTFQPSTIRMIRRMNAVQNYFLLTRYLWFIFTFVVGSSKAIKNATHWLIGNYITSKMEVMYGNTISLIESGEDDNLSNICNLLTLYNHKQFDK